MTPTLGPSTALAALEAFGELRGRAPDIAPQPARRGPAAAPAA
jgi:hypothetical protein